MVPYGLTILSYGPIYNNSFKLFNGVSKLLVKYDDISIIKIPYSDEEKVIFFNIFFIKMDTKALITVIIIEELIENNPKIMEMVNILSVKNNLLILFSFLVKLNTYWAMVAVINDIEVDLIRLITSTLLPHIKL